MTIMLNLRLNSLNKDQKCNYLDAPFLHSSIEDALRQCNWAATVDLEKGEELREKWGEMGL